METTFITIHSLSPEANILYASESIEDILGVQPADVVGKSCFEYFHPDQIPFARRIHGLSVQMDKAASLHYAAILHRDGHYVDCECVFTIVYDVLIACTSIYRLTVASQQRALEAPIIRRKFASSPRDPRYHMLEHLSAKFRAPAQESYLEPRAALILNRFTRTLDVMYATSAVEKVLQLSADQLIDKSFYQCISEACLHDAITALESAKANDSIAYLRFWYRDPRSQEELDEELREAGASSDSEDGGVQLISHPMDIDPVTGTRNSRSSSSGPENSNDGGASTVRPGPPLQHQNSNTTAGESTDLEQDSARSMFDHSAPLSRTSTSTSSEHVEGPSERRRARIVAPPPEPIEIEAVISCTSDGLVVVLRRARPPIPSLGVPARMPLFAAPWGVNPIRPHVHQFNPQNNFQHGLQAPYQPNGGPPIEDFMVSIRDVAVFAWSLTGINGNIAEYGHGTPRGEAFPPDGFPIWDPYAQPVPTYMPPENQAVPRWQRWEEKTNEPFRNRGNVVPYQHFRQEEYLRHQNGFGSEPMGSDRPASMGQGSMNAQVAFAQAGRIQEQLAQNSVSGLQGQQQQNQGQQYSSQDPRGQNKRSWEEQSQSQRGQPDQDDDDEQEFQGVR